MDTQSFIVFVFPLCEINLKFIDLNKKNINAFYKDNLEMDVPNMFENAVNLKSKRPIVKIVINVIINNQIHLIVLQNLF